MQCLELLPQQNKTKKQSEASLSNIMYLSQLQPNELLNKYLIIYVFGWTVKFYCRLMEPVVTVALEF